MPVGNSKRRAFYAVVSVAALSLTVILLGDRSWYQRALPTVTQLASYVGNPVLPEAPREPAPVATAAPEAPADAPKLREPPPEKTPSSSDSKDRRIDSGPVKVSAEITSSSLQTSSRMQATKYDHFVKAPGSSKLEEIRRADLKALSESQLEDLYFSIAEQQHILCPSSQRIGGTLDGGWDVCFSDPFDIRKSRPCVAFSFGINNIWGYDDLLADRYNCMVYMFDPSMSSTADYKRRNTSWFYRTGLSSNNTVASNGWKMRTLCRLFNELGYAGKPVDILKVDIEYWEWDSFEQAIRDGCLRQVKQLLFESHTGEMLRQRSDYARFIRVWRGLFDLGFRTWKWHKNPQSIFYKSGNGVNRACCYEHYMINAALL